MRGKLFILLIMVGIPIMTWVILAWVIMIVLGALHALCSAPSLRILGQFVCYGYGCCHNRICRLHGDDKR